MEKHYFDTSVRVQAGDGKTLRDVRSVEGACEVLIDWPHARRGPFYQSALEVVNAALEGSATNTSSQAASTSARSLHGSTPG